MSRPSRLVIALALITVYLVWSSTYLALRWVVAELPPMGAAGARFVGAGAILLLVARVRGGRMPALRTALWAAPLGVLVFAVGNGFVALAQRTVPSGVAAVACAVVPCFAAGLEAIGGARVRRRELLGIAFGLAGVVTLNLDGLRAGLASPSLLLLLAPLGWALGSVLAKRKLSGDPFGAAAVQMIAGGLAALAISAALGERWPDVVSARAVAAWLYLLVMGSLVAFSAFVVLLFHTPVGVATSYAFVNPVLALLLGWSLEGEVLDAATPWAVCLVLLGLGLVLWRPERAASEELRPLDRASVHPVAAAELIEQVR